MSDQQASTPSAAAATAAAAAATSLSFFGETTASSENEKCQQCLNHLTSLLTSINSKPKALFEAMGVLIPPVTSTSTSPMLQSQTDNKNGIFWTMDDDAKGVRLQIPRNKKSMNKTVNELEHESQSTNVSIELANDQQQNMNTSSSEKNSVNGNGHSNSNGNGKHIVSGFGGASTASIDSNELLLQRQRQQIQIQNQNQILQEQPKGQNPKQQSQIQIQNQNENNNSIPPKKGILQRMKTKLTQTFQTKKLATSSINNNNSHNNNNNKSNNNNNHKNDDDHITLEIQCRECGTTGPEGSARAYLRGPSPLTIILCTNRLSLTDNTEINEVLTHELIHVFDVHHRKWDLSNCQTLARSEIRAAREAECDSINFGYWKKSCVKDKAREATKNMFPYNGFDCVNQVFDEAIVDQVPFHETRGGGNEGGGKSSGSTIATSTTLKNAVSSTISNTISSNDKVDKVDNKVDVVDGFIGGRSFTSSYSSNKDLGLS